MLSLFWAMSTPNSNLYSSATQGLCWFQSIAFWVFFRLVAKNINLIPNDVTESSTEKKMQLIRVIITLFYVDNLCIFCQRISLNQSMINRVFFCLNNLPEEKYTVSHKSKLFNKIQISHNPIYLAVWPFVFFCSIVLWLLVDIQNSHL